MFVRKKHYAQLVRDAAATQERERLVQYLVEQVEYLRLQLGQSTTTVSRSVATTDPRELNFSDIPVEEQPWVGEEEEDLRAMRQAGVLSDEEFTAALTASRQREHIIE